LKGKGDASPGSICPFRGRETYAGSAMKKATLRKNKKPKCPTERELVNY